MSNWITLDYYLIKRTIILLCMLPFAIWCGIAMWNGKDTKTGYYINIRKKIFNILYRRICPIILILGFIWLISMPVLDIVDPSKHTYNKEGILKGVSIHSSRRGRSLLDQYTIKIDDTTYRIPKGVVPHKNILKKGKKYKVWYYKHSRVVYNILPVQ